MNNIILEHNKSKEKPLVSVVIATYKRDKSLEKAILSVANQSYKNIEIVVVDDNSNKIWNKKIKNLVSKLRNNTESNIVYIKNEENLGSAKTRNIGIKETKGKYITFLDDDDIYFKDKIKNQIQNMLNEKSDYSITDLFLYDENNNLIEKRIRKYIKKYDDLSLLKYHFMHHMTGTDVIMFKKEYLLKIGLFPEKDIGDEFYLMHVAIMGKGKLSYLPECNVKAYIHIGNYGLSSGETKLKGENELYEYKKKYFQHLNSKERNYIKMRHFAVMAYEQVRSNNRLGFIRFSIQSFSSAPISFIKLVVFSKFISAPSNFIKLVLG